MSFPIPSFVLLLLLAAAELSLGVVATGRGWPVWLTAGCLIGLVILFAPPLFWRWRAEAWVGELSALRKADAEEETARVIREIARGKDVDPAEEEPPDERWQQPFRVFRLGPVRLWTFGPYNRAFDRFYAQALLQAKIWFGASVIAAFVGLTVIVWGIVQAENQSAFDVVLKAIPGAVAEAVAALFYSQANATRKSAADLLISSQDDRRLETAREILDTIQDVERREEIAAQLAMHFAGVKPGATRRTVRPAQVTAPSHPNPATGPETIADS
jgi:hypothetical protein